MVSGVPFNFGVPGQGINRQGFGQNSSGSGADIFGATGQTASHAGFNSFEQGFSGGPFGFPPGGFGGPPPGGFGGSSPGGPGQFGPRGPRDPRRAEAMNTLRTDLQSAGIDLRSIAQQVAAANNGQVTPQLMDQAIQSAASQVQDSTLQAKILQDVSNLQALGPPPGGPGQFGQGGPGQFGPGGPGRHRGPRDPQRAQAFQQLNTDLQSAGIVLHSIAQQVAAANNGQVTPQLMDQAIQSAASQVQDSTLQAKILQDVSNLQALGPPPRPAGFGGQNPFGYSSAGQGLDISRLLAQQQFPQLGGGQFLGQSGISPELLLSQALQSYGQLSGSGLGF